MAGKRLSTLVLLCGVACLVSLCAGFRWKSDYLVYAYFGFGSVVALIWLLEPKFSPDESAGGGYRDAACLLVLISPLFWFIRPAILSVQQAQINSETHDRLKTIVLALHGYRDANGRLPPAAMSDKAGLPLLSWRVLILPFLGYEELFLKFRLDEPWNSEHNLTLLPFMPNVYAPPGQAALEREPYTTFWQGFVGPDTAFDCPGGCRFPGDFPEGLSMTILLAEGAEAVPWTKPADLVYSPDLPFPKLGAAAGRQASVFFRANSTTYIAWGDGSVRTVLLEDIEADETFLRAAITRNAKRTWNPAWH